MSQEKPERAPVTGPGSFDALQRLQELQKEFSAESEPQHAPAATKLPAHWVRRYIKAAVAAVLAIVLGWVPVSRLLVTSSAEATVNARLITLRAPIDGVIASLSPVADTGDTESGSIFAISNVRTDRSHLDELQRFVDLAETELETLQARRAQLQPLLASFKLQSDAYKTARVAQLTAKVAELKAQVAGTDAQVYEAKAALSRSAALLPTGYLSDATYKKSERDFKVLDENANAARSRLAATGVELAAAQQGIFVGDSYSDTPQSAQRSVELGQQIGDLAIQIAGANKRVTQARRALAIEQGAFAHRSAAEVSLPSKGRVWERLVSAGEEVKQGQELLRVLDCGQAVVTATVSEANYDKLRIGDTAKFRFRNGNDDLEGWIISLNGLAAVPGNFAIDQKAMAREPFHVTVYVPDLANAQDCGIGRSGRVVFAKPESRNFAGALLFSTIR